MRRVYLALTSFIILAAPLAGQLPGRAPTTPKNHVPTHREEAAIIRARIPQRFEIILPEFMRRERIDMWVIVTREYNDDPVFRSMAPLETYSSRRRTVLVFHDRGVDAGVDAISVGRFDYDGLFDLYRTHNDSQFVGLRASAEMLAVGWLERKLPSETEYYRGVMRLAHQVIAEAFSNQVIVPGLTTTDDVVWWMRQRVAEMGLGAWFHPSVDVQRHGGLPAVTPENGHVIQRGDMLHTDSGIVGLGYSTDTQHLAYVLRAGETDAPAGLVDGLRKASRLQDLTQLHAKVGGSGNDALAAALAQAKAEGITPSIYGHPIGYQGHAAGPPIGMTDYQDGVPVRGDYVFRPDTWHSIELNARHAVPEWGGQEVRFASEEDAALLVDGWSWIDGRQSSFYLIR